MKKTLLPAALQSSVLALGLAFGAAGAYADNERSCDNLPSHSELRENLKNVVGASVPTPGLDLTGNGGFDLNMWAVVVNKAGYVCAVAFSGEEWDDQWLGSRQIAAAKANTSNNFSLDGLAFSTAALLPIADTNASLYSLEQGNPLNPEVAYQGPVKRYGQANDPLVGDRPGGTILFGGGLGLFDNSGKVGGIGLSGDTSCADHNVAWRLRDALNLDATPPAGGAFDLIDYASYATTGCVGGEDEIAAALGASTGVTLP